MRRPCPGLPRSGRGVRRPRDRHRRSAGCIERYRWRSLIINDRRRGDADPGRRARLRGGRARRGNVAFFVALALAARDRLPAERPDRRPAHRDARRRPGAPKPPRGSRASGRPWPSTSPPSTSWPTSTRTSGLSGAGVRPAARSSASPTSRGWCGPGERTRQYAACRGACSRADPQPRHARLAHRAPLGGGGDVLARHRQGGRDVRATTRSWPTPPACCTTSASSRSPTASWSADVALDRARLEGHPPPPRDRRRDAQGPRGLRPGRRDRPRPPRAPRRPRLPRQARRATRSPSWRRSSRWPRSTTRSPPTTPTARPPQLLPGAQRAAARGRHPARAALRRGAGRAAGRHRHRLPPRRRPRTSTASWTSSGASPRRRRWGRPRPAHPRGPSAGARSARPW